MRLLIRGLAVVFSPAFAFASLCLPLVGSAWAGSVALSDVENLTPANTGTHDQFPSLSGSFIAWEGEGDPAQMDPEQIHAAPEIFLWNSETETVWQLTDNTRPDEEPIVREDGHAVWYSCDGQSPQPWECLPVEGQPNTGDTEIMYWNGSMAVPLTDNAFDDGDADIATNGVVWEHFDGEDEEILYWNGSTTVALTDNSVKDDDPKISGNYIVWHACDGAEVEGEFGELTCTTDREIYLYDLSTQTTVQLTDNSIVDENPATDGTGVAWHACDSDLSLSYGECGDGSAEIFYWPGTGEAMQLTSNEFTDLDADLSDGQVVWSSADVDGSIDTLGLYYWKNGETTRLRTVPTAYGETGVEIDGERLVWQESESEEFDRDVDILTATVPEPGVALLALGALLTLAGMRRRVR